MSPDVTLLEKIAKQFLDLDIDIDSLAKQESILDSLNEGLRTSRVEIPIDTEPCFQQIPR